MAKLVTSAALICVFLAIIANSVSGYRKIITTVVIDDHPNEDSKCKKEVQSKDLNSCESYVRQSGSSSEGVYLAMRGTENQQQQVPKQCCNQIKNLRDDCQCEGVRYVIQKQIGQKQRGTKEYDEGVLRASQIVTQCGLQEACELPG